MTVPTKERDDDEQQDGDLAFGGGFLESKAEGVGKNGCHGESIHKLRLADSSLADIIGLLRFMCLSRLRLLTEFGPCA